ncbi:MAG: LysR family glycine cleavage system transcriptional activator, partial [Cognaticolwellia sp.]
VCPFKEVLISKNSYYIVCREQQLELGKITAFREWVLQTVADEQTMIDEGQLL